MSVVTQRAGLAERQGDLAPVGSPIERQLSAQRPQLLAFIAELHELPHFAHAEITEPALPADATARVAQRDQPHIKETLKITRTP